MKTKCLIIVLLVMTTTQYGYAWGQKQKNAPAAETVHAVLELEGKWKVTSTTWGGDQNDFIGMIYNIDVDLESIVTEHNTTEFVAVLNSMNKKDSGLFGFKPATMNNEKFCVMRYSDLPKSYKLFKGYPRPAFWHPDDYPCAAEDFNEQNESDPDNDDEDQSISLNSSKHLLRLNFISDTEIHAIIYYELSAFEVAPKDMLMEEDMDDEDFIGCAKELCYGGYVLSMGTFELVLKKLN